MEIDSVLLPIGTKFNAAVDQQHSPSRFVVNDHSGCGQHRQAKVIVKRSRRCSGATHLKWPVIEADSKRPEFLSITHNSGRV